MNSIQNIVIGLFAFVLIASVFNNCRDRQHYDRVVETRTITASQNLVDASEQFDLRVLEKLLKETSDAATLEKRLNDSNPALHNLDLDEDGEVDYIQVEEFGSGNDRGLSLFVELPPLEGETEPQVQEIASIQVSKESDTRGRYEIHGNRHIYGHNHYYHSSFGLGDYLMLRWMFSDHNRYSSPWGYNRYPSTYRSWDPVPNDRYQRNTRSFAQGSSLSSSSQSTMTSAATSPNANKNASNVKAPLKNPTSTQKSFQARNPSKQVRSGGFGRTSSSSPSVRKSSSSRSGSYSGGGK